MGILHIYVSTVQCTMYMTIYVARLEATSHILDSGNISVYCTVYICCPKTVYIFRAPGFMIQKEVCFNSNYNEAKIYKNK